MSTDTKTEAVGEHRRLESNEFRDIIGRFASGVTVITVEHEDQRYGTTASAVCSLSLEPPMLLVCLNKSSSTGQAIAAARHFAVNILGEGQADAAMRFAGKGDKFAGQRIVRGVAGQPLLGDALANLECRVAEEVTGGTHTVFLGEVEHATGGHGAPLAYFRGQFGRLELKQDEDAHHDIRARVLSRELPAGEPLSLDAVAELVGVPRGSAYHALTKLSGEGLVTRTADGQFVVTPRGARSSSAWPPPRSDACRTSSWRSSAARCRRRDRRRTSSSTSTTTSTSTRGSTSTSSAWPAAPRWSTCTAGSTRRT